MSRKLVASIRLVWVMSAILYVNVRVAWLIVWGCSRAALIDIWSTR